MILNETVDFAISTFALRDSRKRVVDFMVTNHRQQQGYIYIKNPDETFDWDVYGQPFWRNTWISIITYFMIIPIFIRIILERRK